MALEKINVGTVANDRTGDPLRDGFEKINLLIPADPVSDNTFALSGLNELVNTADLTAFFQWSFDTSTSNADPGAGNFRFNNASPSLATEMYLSDTARNGVNLITFSNLVHENSSVFIKKHSDLGNHASITINGAPSDASGYFVIPIQNGFVGSFVAGDVCDFSFEQQRELNGVIHINSLADFPDPVLGVIEIGGSINTYIIQAGEVDISPNVLKVTGGVVVIQGSNRYTSTLKSDSTDPLITITDAFYADEFLNIDNANGPAYDYDGGGIVNGVFVLQNNVIRACTTVGNIKDANTTSLRTCTVGTTSAGGFTFEGTGLRQINISDFFGVSWTGTLIDLNTAEWGIINIQSSSRFVSPSGTIILEGDPGAGNNLSSGGRALVAGNLFNGLGTALSNVDPQDPEWNFRDNVFVDGVTSNTKENADAFLTSAETVTIGSTGVYVAVAGVNWDFDLADMFTVSTAGIIEFIGLDNLDVKITAASTIEKVGGGSDLICTKLAVDTGSGFVVVDKTIGCTENTAPTQVSSQGLITLSPGDKIQLFTANIDSTSDIIVSESNVIVTKNQ